MSTGTLLLGLLEGAPSHGYDLKRAYDARFGGDRPLAYGQIYSTLARLLKGGLVAVDGVEPGGGPERKRYAITPDGVADVDRWLGTPESPDSYLRSTLCRTGSELRAIGRVSIKGLPGRVLKLLPARRR